MAPEPPLLLVLDLTGTFAFAVNGALTALRLARLDIVGVGSLHIRENPLCLMAIVCRGQLGDVDIEKLLKICIVHDLGEAIAGDISAKAQAQRRLDDRAGGRVDIGQVEHPAHPHEGGEDVDEEHRRMHRGELSRPTQKYFDFSG